MHTVLISTRGALIRLLTDLTCLQYPLYLDLEGNCLSRHGTLSLIILYHPPWRSIYLIDVHTLGATAFSTATPEGVTLKGILEAPTWPKVFFDVRNDSDALFSHFGVRLRGVEDVQLMENAARPAGQRRLLNGLQRCIEMLELIPDAEKEAWKAAKQRGRDLYDPARGGGEYDVFDERPLREEVVRYCANDVRYLPVLRDSYWACLDRRWRIKVREETQDRVAESQSEDYVPNSRNKARGPWGAG
jgi:exonuclease 3'-5' domain-containing protein 1